MKIIALVDLKLDQKWAYDYFQSSTKTIALQEICTCLVGERSIKNQLQ